MVELSPPAETESESDGESLNIKNLEVPRTSIDSKAPSEISQTPNRGTVKIKTEYFNRTCRNVLRSQYTDYGDSEDDTQVQLTCAPSTALNDVDKHNVFKWVYGNVLSP